MKWYNKILGAGALALASLSFSPKKAEACSSAIPIGRGSTNVAVADGASAVYWNPAGLVQLERPELDVTVSPDNRYKAFLCYGQPLSRNSAIGLNFSYRKDDEFFENGDDYTTLWLKLGYSRKLGEKFSMGGNLTIRREYMGDRVMIDYNTKNPTFLDGDLGFLYKPNNKIRLGLKLDDLRNNACINVRPGASLKLDDKTLLACEGYDVTNVFNSRNLSSGLERKINDRWSIRGGIRIWENKFENGGAFDGLVGGSCGASYRKGNLEISMSIANGINLTLNKKF